MFIKSLLVLVALFIASCGQTPAPIKPDPKLDFLVNRAEMIEVIGRLGDKSNLKVECVKEEFELATDLLFQ